MDRKDFDKRAVKKQASGLSEPKGKGCVFGTPASGSKTGFKSPSGEEKGSADDTAPGSKTDMVKFQDGIFQSPSGEVKKEPVPPVAVKKQPSEPIELKDDSVPGRCSSSVRPQKRPWSGSALGSTSSGGPVPKSGSSGGGRAPLKRSTVKTEPVPPVAVKKQPSEPIKPKVENEPVPPVAVKKQPSERIEPKVITSDSASGSKSSGGPVPKPGSSGGERVQLKRPAEKGSADDTASGFKTGSLSDGGMGRPESPSGEALFEVKKDEDTAEEKLPDGLLIRLHHKGIVRAIVFSKPYSLFNLKGLVERTFEIGSGSFLMRYKLDDDWCDLDRDSDWEGFVFFIKEIKKDSKSLEISVADRNK